MDTFNILDFLILTSYILAFVAISCWAGRKLADAHNLLELSVPDEPSTPSSETISTTVYILEKQDLPETESHFQGPSEETLIVFRNHIIERQGRQATTWIAPRAGLCPTQQTRQVYKPNPAPLRKLAKRLAERRNGGGSITLDAVSEKKYRATCLG